jgi:hypothetical protein
MFKSFVVYFVDGFITTKMYLELFIVLKTPESILNISPDNGCNE